MLQTNKSKKFYSNIKNKEFKKVIDIKLILLNITQKHKKKKKIISSFAYYDYLKDWNLF